ncbi:MAG: transposase family protein [Thermodesulfobacteriota bacterium]|nr:transposase family protein [Thermodesulfobacteriota bacterium]
MSEVSIIPYFPFRRIKIAKQEVNNIASKAVINAVPDKRFHPICYLCGQKVSSFHSWTKRSIRDLNLAGTQVWLHCEYRKLFCSNCQRISIIDKQYLEAQYGQPNYDGLRILAVDEISLRKDYNYLAEAN